MGKSGSKALASLLIAVLLVSSLYTSIPNSHKLFSWAMLPSSLPMAFADYDDNRRHNDNKDDGKENKPDDLDDEAEELVEEYEDLVKELGKISNVSDEAVVVDYLIGTISELKEDTTNLISNKKVERSLLDTLDRALKHAEKAGEKTLRLKETDSNREIDKSRKSIENYIDKVKKYSGSRIPVGIADLLVLKADKISNDSLRRGIDATHLVSEIPLLITSQILDKSKSDVSELQVLAGKLASLGFMVDIEARTMSPTRGFVIFSNPDTLQKFKIEVIPQALAAITAVLIAEDATAEAPHTSVLAQDPTLSTEEFAALMAGMPLILASVLNNPQIQIVVRNSLALIPLCVLTVVLAPECALIIVGVTFSVALALYLQEHPEALEEFRSAIEEAAEILQNIVEDILVQGSPPRLIIIKEVINDNGGNSKPNDFTIHITNNDISLPDINGAAFPGTVVTLDPGSYDVTEEPDDGYDSVFSGECSSITSGPIIPSQTRNCTITNNDIPATLTVIKKIINDNGGTLILDETTLRIDGIIVENGTKNALNAGVHLVSEDEIPEYQTSFSGDCAPDGSIMLDVGDEKECIITNDDTPSSLSTFLDDSFDTGLDGWSYFGDIGYELSLYPSDGQPAPSARISGGTFLNKCSVHGMEKTIDISSHSNKAAILKFDYRASSFPLRVNTLEYNIRNADTGASLYTERVVDVGQDIDTGWRIYSKDISEKIAGVDRIKLQLYLYDCWAVGYDHQNFYDNITLFETVEPDMQVSTQTLTPVFGPYFSVELDQVSANATRPTSIEIPLEVEWFEGWNASSITIMVDNLDDTNITHTITNVSSQKDYQIYHITFSVSQDTQPGLYEIPIRITEVSTGDTVLETFVLDVK